MLQNLSSATIGSDVLVQTNGPSDALNEGPMRRFLEKVQNFDDQPVIDFAFGTMQLEGVKKRSGIASQKTNF